MTIGSHEEYINYRYFLTTGKEVTMVIYSISMKKLRLPYFLK